MFTSMGSDDEVSAADCSAGMQAALREYVDAVVATDAAIGELGALVPSPEVWELMAAVAAERTAARHVTRALSVAS